MSRRLRLDPIACDGHGNCHELLPEVIGLDRWGYPIVCDGPLPASLEREAKRAVLMCPKIALALETIRERG